MNPEASSPTPADQPASDAVENDILDTLGLSDPENNAAPPAPAEAPAAVASPQAVPGEAVGSAPASPDTPQEPTPAPTPAAAAPTDGTPPAPAALAPSEPPPAAPPADEAALREASLRAINDALTRTVEQLRANPQGQPAQAGGPAASPGEQSAEPAPFRYSLTLPEATQKALLSEDPQQNLAAINSIVNDLGTIVHNTVLTQVRSEVRGAFSTLMGMANASTANQTQEQAREAARETYFTAFPAHRNELIEPIIRQQAVKLSAEHPGLSFDQQYINALGARVNAVIEQLRTPADGEPASGEPAPANPTPARPAAHLPTGVRGSGAQAPTGSDLGEDIMGTLDPFSG